MTRHINSVQYHFTTLIKQYVKLQSMVMSQVKAVASQFPRQHLVNSYSCNSR